MRGPVRTAGPSTTLRFGRDDKSKLATLVRFCDAEGEIQDSAIPPINAE
jgi:hypothetical protein